MAFLIAWLIRITVFSIWIAGIVIAKGFWSTLFAIFIPPWSWYLVIERVLIINGII